MKIIALALLNYRDIHQAFPPAITYAEDGTPLHSWRLFIQPFVAGNEGNRLFHACDLTQPWNGSRNRLLFDDIPDDSVLHLFYRCPASPRTFNRPYTNYVMIIDDRSGRPHDPLDRPGGIPHRPDDTSAVIVIEIAETDILWMEPRDVLLSELSFRVNDRTRISLSSYHLGGAFAIHADGSVRFVLEDADPEYISELLGL